MTFHPHPLAGLDLSLLLSVIAPAAPTVLFTQHKKDPQQDQQIHRHEEMLIQAAEFPRLARM